LFFLNVTFVNLNVTFKRKNLQQHMPHVQHRPCNLPKMVACY